MGAGCTVTAIRSPYRWGRRSLTRLQTCTPEIQRLLTEALEHPDCPCDMTIVYGHRSHDKQAELYAIGRTKPGSIVTNAKPGQSRHNSFPSEAIDVGPCNVSGVVLWNDKDKFDAWGEHVKKTADELGIAITWGGDFSWYDGAHFELTRRSHG